MLLEPVSSTLERDLSLSLVMGVSGRQTVVVFDAVAELSLGSLLLLLLRSWSLISSFNRRRGCDSIFALISGAWRVRGCGNTINSEEVTKESGERERERENLVLDSELAFSEGLQIAVRDCAGC
jgi:hypothetical protein